MNVETKALEQLLKEFQKLRERFIRKAENPDLPYYTLELSPKGDIVQCRGNHNCDMTDEVKAFVKLWHETVVMKKKKGKVA